MFCPFSVLRHFQRALSVHSGMKSEFRAFYNSLFSLVVAVGHNCGNLAFNQTYTAYIHVHKTYKHGCIHMNKRQSGLAQDLVLTCPGPTGTAEMRDEILKQPSIVVPLLLRADN